jgi:hypothetical protein
MHYIDVYQYINQALIAAGAAPAAKCFPIISFASRM